MKKLEIVGCLRFRDGDGAEGDWEEWGAMMQDDAAALANRAN